MEFWAAFRKMSTLVDTKFNYFLQTESFRCVIGVSRTVLRRQKSYKDKP